ncbi:hypothetical protein KM043_008047 [Ampulex compressa]|nr:hypothetical protein KM043_008047 [Ampulex compressa]
MLCCNGNLPVLSYGPQDFHFSIDEDTVKYSTFDTLLMEKWYAAEQENVLRYTLNVKNVKRLEGEYQFLMQLNLDRVRNRRPPEHILSTNQPFDPVQFNFTKIPQKEILFDLGNGDGNDVVAVNVSPIEHGHCLLLMGRLKESPQVATRHSIRKALHLLLLSSSPFLRVVFNSLCAYASVNHLHWHFYYLPHKMLLEYIDLRHFLGPIYILESYPAKGFCLKWSMILDVETFVSWAFLIVDHMQGKDIPHNVCITRAKIVVQEEKYTDIRIYIWARKPDMMVKDITFFKPAVCELFGHLLIRKEAYQNIIEEDVINILEDTTNKTFLSVQSELRHLIEQELLSGCFQVFT